MTTEKRSLLAFALIIVFLYVWFEHFVPKPEPLPTKPAEVTQETTSPSPASTLTSKTEADGKKEEPVKALPHLEKVEEIKVHRETSLMDLIWTNHPGSVERVELKEFAATLAKDSPPVHVIPFQGDSEPPLTWAFELEGTPLPDQGTAFKEVSSGEGRLVYEGEINPGVTVRKHFTWKDDTYDIEQLVQIQNRRDRPIRIKAQVELASREKVDEDEKKGGWFSQMGRTPPLSSVAYINERSVRLNPKDVIDGEKFPPGEIAWTGFDSQYFLLAALPLEGRWSELDVSAKLTVEKAKDLRLTMLYPPRDIPAGALAEYRVKLYAGPKDIGLLRNTGASLDRAIDLGDWLGPIARPILLFLRWLYSVIPNYGIAIIILTVLVRLLMFPLAQKQAKSMQKMQVHKPELDALKEKYKDKKEEYSREMMNYMRKHKINPMGGCLLLLPQMPIFFALYRVLYNSIELRHAPFVFWIKDLSAADPIFVLPVLLGIVMFLQQRMTPTPTADPAQQMMMKFMPVMFCVFMLFLPAGLNLYIFVSTLWGVVQQALVQKKLMPATNQGTTKVQEKRKKLEVDRGRMDRNRRR